MSDVKLMIAPTLIVAIMTLLVPSLAQATDDDPFAEGALVYSTIAGIGCKTCHGEYAEGDVGVGPYIRGATEGMIRAAIDATNEMIVIRSAITDEQIQAVAAYVGRLGTLQVARTLAKRGRFLPAEVSIQPGIGVQLIIQNSSVEPHVFKSDNMGIYDLIIAGRSSGTIEWSAPTDSGAYSLYCVDCTLQDQFFTIRVDPMAAEFKAVVPVGKAANGEM